MYGQSLAFALVALLYQTRMAPHKTACMPWAQNKLLIEHGCGFPHAPGAACVWATILLECRVLQPGQTRGNSQARCKLLMCFSAEASFAASGALAASSIAISRIPKSRSEIPLSLCPAIFAAHQFVEGILWLNHGGTLPDEYKAGAVYSFIFIAMVLWPIYVPFSAWMIETGRIRRIIILICQLIGLYVGITFLMSIIRGPVDASVVGHSFAYKTDITESLLAPYFVAVSIPFLVSRRKGLVLFGVALSLACGAALFIASSQTFPSMWCFLAAILSLGLYMYFRRSAESAITRQPVPETREQVEEVPEHLFRR